MRQEQNGYANLVLDSELKACKPPLSPRDAAFASGIFYTVLERRSLLDWMLAQFSKRPLEKLDAPVRAILRAGLAQAKFMDVPLPAAVNESVKLAKAFGKTSAAGMVNAMLRRTAALDPKPEHWPDLEERLRTYYCLSQPIAALFAAQYPQDAEAMAAAFYQRRPTAIRVNPLRTTDEALTQTLQQEGHTVTAGPWPHCLLVMFNGNPAASKAFHAGQFHVQGLASQFAALCCDARPGMRVLDLCAGTGCLGIGIRHFVPSASVTCVEKSPQALQYLQANVHGTGVQAKAADVLQYWRELMPQSMQLIISNPPYLTGAEMQALMPETAHEPAMALDGGTDGLDFYRAIAAHYRDIVCPGGWLVFEIGCAQRADVMEICRQNGWQQVQARKDYGGNDRVVYAQRVKYI